MTEFAGLLALVALAAQIGGLLGASATRLLLPIATRDRIPPAMRCRRIEWLTLLPLIGLALGTMALLLPALLKLIGVIDDHCIEHGSHHPHFCLRHLPDLAAGPLLLAAVPLALAPLPGLVRAVRAQWRQSIRLRTIARVAGRRRGLVTLHGNVPHAFVLGTRTPLIVLSDTLKRTLSGAERRAVVRHEIAHARAGDQARRTLLGLLLPFHFSSTGQRLLRRWSQAAEERADDHVAARGQALDLAAALVTLLRLRQGSPDTTVMAADAGDVPRRVRRLVGSTSDTPAPPRFECLFATGIGLAIAWCATGHHAVETALGWLIGH